MKKVTIFLHSQSTRATQTGVCELLSSFTGLIVLLDSFCSADYIALQIVSNCVISQKCTHCSQSHEHSIMIPKFSMEMLETQNYSKTYSVLSNIALVT